MIYGYARVSTIGQDLRTQVDKLTKLGCKVVFQEKESGAKTDRPELKLTLEAIEQGDTIIVTRLDRLARSTTDLLHIVQQIADKGATLKSIAEPWINGNSPTGKLMLTLIAGIAEFERSLILQRTAEGRQAAKERGVKMGRPEKVSKKRIEQTKALMDEGYSILKIAKKFRMSPQGLYTGFQRQGFNVQAYREQITAKRIETRRKKLSNRQKNRVLDLVNAGHQKKYICELLGVSFPTLQKALRDAQAEL